MGKHKPSPLSGSGAAASSQCKRLQLSFGFTITGLIVLNYRIIFNSHQDEWTGRTASGVAALEAMLVSSIVSFSNQTAILNNNIDTSDPINANKMERVLGLADVASQNTTNHDTAATPIDSFPREPVPRPPLDSIVQGWNVIGDASWLMNVAVIGMPKCGTSSLMFQLKGHPEVQMFGRERCEMGGNQHVPLIRDLYSDFPPGDYVRGIKCPQDLESSKLALRNYQKFFPKTDFIVGLRHPILWFESFYNFRIHNKFQMLPFGDNLIGSCMKGYHGVCTMRGNFHFFLNHLGKVLDPAAARYFPKSLRKHQDPVNLTSRILLFEVSQISPKDPIRADQFREDLRQFLHLRQPFPPMIWFRPGVNHTDSRTLRRLNEKKVDICEEKYSRLRSVLLEQSINASHWIREYFIRSPDVVVSSKDHFVNVIMPTWEQDPCLERHDFFNATMDRASVVSIRTT